MYGRVARSDDRGENFPLQSDGSFDYVCSRPSISSVPTEPSPIYAHIYMYMCLPSRDTTSRNVQNLIFGDVIGVSFSVCFDSKTLERVNARVGYIRRTTVLVSIALIAAREIRGQRSN